MIDHPGQMLLRWILSSVVLTLLAFAYAWLEAVGHQDFSMHSLFLPLTWPIRSPLLESASGYVLMVAVFANAALISGALLLAWQLLRRLGRRP